MIGFGLTGVVNNLRGPALNLVTALSSSALRTTFGFGSLSIGTESSDRFIIIGVGAAGVGIATFVSSVVVNGTNAATIVEADSAGGSNFNKVVGLYGVVAPTGTTAVVTAQMGHATDGCSIGIYSMTAWNSTAAISTATIVSSVVSPTVTALSTSIANADGGAIMGIGGCHINTAVTWTGLTENYDQVSTGTFAQTNSGASATVQPLSASRTVTSTFASPDSRVALALASWR